MSVESENCGFLLDLLRQHESVHVGHHAVDDDQCEIFDPIPGRYVEAGPESGPSTAFDLKRPHPHLDQHIVQYPAICLIVVTTMHRHSFQFHWESRRLRFVLLAETPRRTVECEGGATSDLSLLRPKCVRLIEPNKLELRWSSRGPCRRYRRVVEPSA